MAEGQPIRTFQPVKFFEDFRWLAEIQAKNRALKVEQEASKVAANLEVAKAEKSAKAEAAKKAAESLPENTAKAIASNKYEEVVTKSRIELQNDLIKDLKQLHEEAGLMAVKDMKAAEIQHLKDENDRKQAYMEANNPQGYEFVPFDPVKQERQILTQVFRHPEFYDEFVRLTGNINEADYSAFMRSDTDSIEGYVHKDNEIQDFLDKKAPDKVSPAQVRDGVFNYAKYAGYSDKQADQISSYVGRVHQERQSTERKKENERYAEWLENVGGDEDTAKMRTLIIGEYKISNPGVDLLKVDTKEAAEEAKNAFRVADRVAAAGGQHFSFRQDFGKAGTQILAVRFDAGMTVAKEYLGISTEPGVLSSFASLTKGLLGLTDDEMTELSVKMRHAENEAAKEKIEENPEWVKEHGNSLVQRATMVDISMGHIFTEFRGVITGAQASHRELVWLMNYVFNPSAFSDDMEGQLRYWYGSLVLYGAKNTMESKLGVRLPENSLYAWDRLYHNTKARVFGIANKHRALVTDKTRYDGGVDWFPNKIMADLSREGLFNTRLFKEEDLVPNR